MKNVQNLPIISSKRTYKKVLPFFETGEPSDYDEDFDVFRQSHKYDSDDLYSFETSTTDYGNRPDDTKSEDRRIYGLFINEETGPDRERRRNQISPSSSQASINFDGISPLASLDNVNIPKSLLLQIMGEKEQEIYEYEYEEDEEEKERKRNKKPKEKKRKRKRRSYHRYVPPEEKEARRLYWEKKQQELDKLRAKMLEKQRKKKEKLLNKNKPPSPSKMNESKQDETNSQELYDWDDTNTEIFIDDIDKEKDEKKEVKSPFANREFLYIDDTDSPGALRKAKENQLMRGTESDKATKKNMNNTKEIFHKINSNNEEYNHI